jgi:hypothetical protein
MRSQVTDKNRAPTMEPGAMHKEKEEELNHAPNTRAKAAWPKSGGAKMYANKGGKWFFEKKGRKMTHIFHL